jgi:hypothetical protein
MENSSEFINILNHNPGRCPASLCDLTPAGLHNQLMAKIRSYQKLPDGVNTLGIDKHLPPVHFAQAA